MAKPADFSVTPSHQPTASKDAPNVEAAKAAEDAVLQQIKARVPAEDWPRMLDVLQRPNGIITATGDPQLSALIAKYYEATRRTYDEQRRQKSVDRAYQRGATVVIALGATSSGTVAEVLRRPANDVREVIVLAPGATAETLGAALETLNQSRARDGDLLADDQRLALHDVRSVRPNAARQKHLAQLMEQLHSAPTRNIEGIGSVKAIDIKTTPLGKSAAR